MVDPEGYIALVAPGEFDLEAMSAELSRVVERASRAERCGEGRTRSRSRSHDHEGPLRFPTRAILALGRLWVSDTGNGRVLECAWDPAERSATVLVEHAGFAEPRGIAELDGHVYVADRAGHAVWRLGRTGAVAGYGGGHGHHGRARSLRRSGPARGVALSVGSGALPVIDWS